MNTHVLQPASDRSDLTIQGSYRYHIHQDRVTLSFDRLNSDRPLGNLSGTIQISLRAYRSQTLSSQGITLASTTLGELKGQHFIENCQYDLIFQQPPAGSWYLAIELSEWAGDTYLLQHVAWFDMPYQVDWTPSIVEEISNNVIQADFEAKAVLPSVSVNASSTKESRYERINSMTPSELKAIRGVSKKLVDKLIKERPFKSEKAILNVKGMGPKLLSRILEAIKE